MISTQTNTPLYLAEVSCLSGWQTSCQSVDPWLAPLQTFLFLTSLTALYHVWVKMRPVHITHRQHQSVASLNLDGCTFESIHYSWIYQHHLLVCNDIVLVITSCYWSDIYLSSTFPLSFYMQTHFYEMAQLICAVAQVLEWESKTCRMSACTVHFFLFSFFFLHNEQIFSSPTHFQTSTNLLTTPPHFRLCRVFLFCTG